MFSNRGMTLVEVIIATGVLSALAFSSMKMMTSQKVSLKKIEVSLEIANIHSWVSQHMLDRTSCTNTFAALGTAMATNATNNIPRIVGRAGNPNIPVNQEIIYNNVNTKVRIASITTRRTGGAWLDQNFNAIQMQLVYNRTNRLVATTAEPDIINYINLLVYYDSAAAGGGRVTSCYTDTTNAITSSKKEFCTMVGGTVVLAASGSGEIQSCDMIHNGAPPSAVNINEANTLFTQNRMDAAATSVATMMHATYVHKTGDTMTGPLTNNVRVNSPRFCIGANCRITFADQSCSGNNTFFKTLNASGTASCEKVVGQCSGNTPFTDGFVGGAGPNKGALNCVAAPSRTCASNEWIYRIDPDGTVYCQPFAYTVMDCGAAAANNFLWKFQDSTTSCTHIDFTSINCGTGAVRNFGMINPTANACGATGGTTTRGLVQGAWLFVDRNQAPGGGWSIDWSCPNGWAINSMMRIDLDASHNYIWPFCTEIVRR